MRAVAAAVANLERHVHEVDALNVFPVPDGDTGSNMLATMQAALAEAERLPPAERRLEAVAEALSRGALTGARGNSGVILSQIIRGMTDGADGRRRANGIDLAQGLRRGSEVAYGSVLTPVEGTILTVIRDAAEAAEAAAGRQPHVEAVLADAIEAAATSVARTPSLLPVLQDAGVVDSGGQGLLRLLEGTLRIADLAPVADEAGAAMSLAPLPAPEAAQARAPAGVETEGTAYGYEAMYLLRAAGEDIDVAGLRDDLESIGESVVVAGDARAVRVHVHSRRPDLALAAGLRAGRLADVSITDLDAQSAAHAAVLAAPAEAGPSEPVAPVSEAPVSEAPTPEAPVAGAGDARRPRGAGEPDEPLAGRGVSVVAVAPADGLARALRSVGVQRIVRPAHGSRPSSGEIAEGILASGTADVIVLPNDPDALLAARLAAGLAPLVTTSVVATRNAAEGVAAALAFDAALPVASNVERMEQAARALHSWSVSRAVRDAVVEGVAVRAGQYLVITADSRLVACADDLVEATLEGIGEHPGPAELVTLYVGVGTDPSLVESLVERIALLRPGVEIEVLEGGQRQSSLLVAVE
jgi:hypothetical protein